MGYIPSFRTACYRLGKTGEHFMELAKLGDIKNRYFLNALTTFQEYLLDYASAKTKKIGENLIHKELKNMHLKQRQLADKLIAQINDSQRGVFI